MRDVCHYDGLSICPTFRQAIEIASFKQSGQRLKRLRAMALRGPRDLVEAGPITAKRPPRSYGFDDFVGLGAEAVARDGVEIGAGDADHPGFLRVRGGVD